MTIKKIALIMMWWFAGLAITNATFAYNEQRSLVFILADLTVVLACGLTAMSTRDRCHKGRQHE